MKVALVVMPFAGADRPSLAVGLLQAGLERRGIRCDAKYFNLTLERLLGAATYHFLASDVPTTVLAGEWAFSQAFYGQAFSDWNSYRREVLEDPVWGLSRRDLHHLHALIETVPLFLRVAYESNDWSEYDLVGFTSTFEQTLPSLALARRIRERHPEVLLAFGGANFEAGMARPYIEHYPFIDFLSTGEADESFPLLCERLREQRAGCAARLAVPAGFLYRDAGAIRGTPRPGGAFVDLETLATPRYDDFFRAARAGNGHQRSWWLPVEAARGCWWGQKAHCTFCGLNGDGMAFRRKSWRRVVAETDELRARYPTAGFQFADNILGMGYFGDLLPFWAERGGSVAKFFEIKSNLRREQVELLRRSGVASVQAGVESLADGTLHLMRKGVSAAQNVAVLRWCVEAGVEPLWNVIYGFPQEDPGDYRRTYDVLCRITHLPPPSVFAPIRMDRFSPHFTAWRDHGFTAVEPIPAYRHVFPFPAADLERLAYYFRYRHPRFEEALAAGRLFHRIGDPWRERARSGSQGELAVRPDPQGGWRLIDTRFNFPARDRRLDAGELAVLLACDAPAPREGALRRAGELAASFSPSFGTDAADPAPGLDRLVAEDVVAAIGSRLLTLALLPAREQLATM